MSRARLTEHSAAQLEAIFDYTEARWGQDQAERYTRAVLQTCNDAAARVSVSRPIDASFGVSGYVVRYGSHLIYWRSRSDGDIDIVAILHDRMHQRIGLKAGMDNEGP